MPDKNKKPGPLATCPFCKGKPKRMSAAYAGELLRVETNPPGAPNPGMHGVYQSLRWHTVKCTECGVSQPKRRYMTRQESDDAWNNRAT